MLNAYRSLPAVLVDVAAWLAAPGCRPVWLAAPWLAAPWLAALRWPAAGFWALAAGIIAVYGAWPDSWWGLPTAASHFAFGLIWIAPNSNTEIYATQGDKTWFQEYHWTGGHWLAGNAYILGGLALGLIVLICAIRVAASRSARTPATVRSGQ